MEKLDRIKIIKAYTVLHTINDPYPQFKIEAEIVDYAKWVNGIISKRTLKSIEKEKGEQGLIGQELFNGFLLQFKIPNVYANPLYEDFKRMRQIDGKHFDFIVPHIPRGKQVISVKTTPERQRCLRFMANVESWKNEMHDIAVAIKIDSLNESKAHIAGWLDAKTVESLPVDDFGTGYAYWTYLDPQLVNENKESEIPKYASHKLKPLNDCRQLVTLLLTCGLDFSVNPAQQR
jgi:hypothetical protein